MFLTNKGPVEEPDTTIHTHMFNPPKNKFTF